MPTNAAAPTPLGRTAIGLQREAFNAATAAVFIQNGRPGEIDARATIAELQAAIAAIASGDSKHAADYAGRAFARLALHTLG